MKCEDGRICVENIGNLTDLTMILCFLLYSTYFSVRRNGCYLISNCTICQYDSSPFCVKTYVYGEHLCSEVSCSLPSKYLWPAVCLYLHICKYTSCLFTMSVLKFLKGPTPFTTTELPPNNNQTPVETIVTVILCLVIVATLGFIFLKKFSGFIFPYILHTVSQI